MTELPRMAEFLSQTLPIIRDGVTTGAAGVAIYVGLAGLNAWRKQLKGKTDYELSRRYLKSVYRIRNEMNKYVRNPYIPLYEMRVARKEEGLEASDISGMDSETSRLVYVRRWRRIMSATEEFETVLLEAEALWGQDAIEAQKDFDGCIKELHSTLMTFLDGRAARHVDVDDIIYATSNSNFTKKIDGAITKIEDYSKKHLS